MEALQPERDLVARPLFQVMFALQNAPASELRLPGLTLASAGRVENGDGEVRPDARRCGRRRAASGGGSSTRTDLFDAATIERLTGHLRRLLEAMVADAERAIGALPLLAGGRARAAAGGVERDRRPPYPREACVHELFEAQAARTPDAVAVVVEGDAADATASSTARANRLAHHLRALRRRAGGAGGAVPGARRRSWSSALLGVLKAGGAYVPLDPAYPRERLAFMLEDAGAARAAHRSRAAGERLPRGRRPWSPGRATRGAGRGAGGRPGAARSTPDHLAYVIYTSGSTGRPKGVRVAAPQRGATWSRDAPASAFGAGRRVALLLAPSPSTLSTSGSSSVPLLHGGALVLVPPRARRDRRRLVRAARARAACTRRCRLTAGALRSCSLEQPAGAGLAGLRCVLCGGEALPPRRWRERAAARPAARWSTCYGPTETHRHAPADRSRRSASGAPVPIGRPIGEHRASYVLDRGGRAGAGRRARASCYIGGAGVARGYLGRPGADRRALRPRPVQPASRARGCTAPATWRAGGRTATLEFLGRIDHQVKIRGFRIELGEIEARAARRTRRARGGGGGARGRAGRQAAGRLRRRERGAPTARGRCARTLRERLPEYMVPAAFVRARRAAADAQRQGRPARRCPRPERRARRGAEYVAPRTRGRGGAGRRSGRRCWASSGSGVDDDFFELGGHSLLADAGGLARCGSALGVELPLRALFEEPTVRGAARPWLERARRGGDGRAAGASCRVERGDGPLPLSFAQQRLWFLDQLEPGEPRLQHRRWRCGCAGALDAAGAGSARSTALVAPPRGAAHRRFADRRTASRCRCIAPRGTPASALAGAST